jgi:hypothetical protein
MACSIDGAVVKRLGFLTLGLVGRIGLDSSTFPGPGGFVSQLLKGVSMPRLIRFRGPFCRPEFLSLLARLGLSRVLHAELQMESCAYLGSLEWRLMYFRSM